MTHVYERLTTDAIARAFYQDKYASWHKDYDACQAIAAYLEEYAESTGEPIKLDTVAFRCDFSLYADIAELNKEYDTDFANMEELQDVAQIIDVDGTKFVTDYSG